MDPANGDGFVVAAEAVGRRGILGEVWEYLAAAAGIAGRGEIALPEDSEVLLSLAGRDPVGAQVVRGQAWALIDAVRSDDPGAVPAAFQALVDGPDYMMWLTWTLAVAVRRIEEAAGGAAQVAGQIRRHWRNAVGDQELYAQQAAYIAALHSARRHTEAEAALDDLLGRSEQVPHLLLGLWVAVIASEGRAVFMNPETLGVTEPAAVDAQALADGTVHIADATIASLVDAARAAAAEEPGADERALELLAGVAALPAEAFTILIRHLARAAGAPLDRASLTRLGVVER